MQWATDHVLLNSATWKKKKRFEEFESEACQDLYLHIWCIVP